MGNFRYHTGCEELKIRNLCFADGLLILCNGDCESVKVIKSALEEFSAVSGLVPNLSKSTMFCININEELKGKILKIIPFAVGRMQLIASVLSAMQTYWASVFFLPKTIIKEIDSLLKSFLWSQGEKVNGKAKIAWKNEVPIDDNASWGWRKLLELREQVRPHIRHCLGNGEDTNMWHDCWCDIGPIDKVVTRRQIYSAGFLNNATVASMFGNRQNKIPDDWIVQNRALEGLKPNLNQNEMDKDKKKDWKEVWGIIEETVKMKMISLKVVKPWEGILSVGLINWVSEGYYHKEGFLMCRVRELGV
ncbi:hypothetical protein Tco_1084159, partial [Tanacetum coccineum]